MTARSGKTRRELDRHFPFQVEVAARPSDYIRLHEMAEYCRLNGFEFRTRGIGGLRLYRGRDATRWCFALEKHAVEFHRLYGGEQIQRS